MPQTRYEVLGTIGVGATSRVDKARDTLIDRIVALKTFGHGFGSGELQKQFLREAQIVGRLSHPNIVGLYDIGTNDDGAAFLVLEYVDGKTLEGILSEGPLQLDRVALWAGDLATALGRAHRAGVIHGDVKPANILVTKDGDVKLGDFGIARFATQVSGTGKLMGTPAYLSPEQIQGKPQDVRSDLFSMGIILYEMATGMRPFNGTSVSAVCAQIISIDPPPPSQHREEISPEFDRIVMRCLAKDPANRYPSAEALASSLYPLARRSGATKFLPKRLPWLQGSLRAGDLWVAAGVLGALVLSVPVIRAVHRRWSHTAPVQAASQSLTVTPTQTIDSVSPNSDLSVDAAKPLRISGVQLISDSSSPASDASQPNVAVAPVDAANSDLAAVKSPVKSRAKNRTPRIQAANSRPQLVTAMNTPVTDVPSHAPMMTSSLPSNGHMLGVAEHASLTIDVSSTVNDETIAVYADQQLLATAPLAKVAQGAPLELQRPIGPGPHQFRVALYRADQSLHTEKEGLAEIQPGSENKLAVHVGRKSKMLVKHETSLDVTWPGAPAVAEKRAAIGGEPQSSSFR